MIRKSELSKVTESFSIFSHVEKLKPLSNFFMSPLGRRDIEMLRKMGNVHFWKLFFKFYSAISQFEIYFFNKSTTGSMYFN